MRKGNIDLIVKNMVCSRCIKVVKEELTKNNINFLQVELGVITFTKSVLDKEKDKLISILKKEGFELVTDRDAELINQIKIIVIENIHYDKKQSIDQSFSNFLSVSIGVEYSLLSKLFSEIEGKTIERYSIEQRIELAKELLIYNEMTLSQISYKLDYSSPQHLSRQFKQITGLTPSGFKKIGKRKKLDTI